MNKQAEPAADKMEFTVARKDSGLRLDKFLADALEPLGVSREKVKKMVKEGAVLADGAPVLSPKLALYEGTVLSVALPERRAEITPEEGELPIVYRDAALALVNKPAGLTVHPAPSCPDGTLAHRLLAHFPELAGQEGERPGIVHRLDKDTSGLMLVALTEACRLALAEDFAEHAVYKEYLALVHGVPKRAEEEINLPIGRDPRSKVKMAVVEGGRPARSRRRTLHADPEGRFSVQAVRIYTGRTHQIRVHMTHAGHPLLGDSLYKTPASAAFSESVGAKRQMLHAWRLSFEHPFPEVAEKPAPPARVEDGRYFFMQEPPQDFWAVLEILLRRPLRAVLTGHPGSGKSALSEEWRGLGVPVFSADTAVRELYEPGGDGHSLLRSSFGERFVPNIHAPVDKAALAAAFLESDHLRREVEALIHPLVRHKMEALWAESAAFPLSVAEIPLYLESAAFKGAKQAGADDVVAVAVHCPFAVRRQRLEARGWTQEFISRVESWHWPEEKKEAACAFVVPNTGTREDLAREARTLYEKLTALKEQKDAERLSGVMRAIALYGLRGFEE